MPEASGTGPINREVPLASVRLCYAENIRRSAGLRSRALAEAFGVVPRERYLGPGPWQVCQFGDYELTEDADPRHVYHDVLIAIDASRKLNNGHPSSLAGWLDELALAAGETVLHIGCGTGYYTAIMAETVGATGRVTALEIDAELAERARVNLADYRNVTVITANGTSYDPGESNAIFVNAGVTHPETQWLDRLVNGGRLVLPLTATKDGAFGSGKTGNSGGNILLVTRKQDQYAASFIGPVSIFASSEGRNPEYNRVLQRAFLELSSGKREAPKMIRRDKHKRDSNCWIHADSYCLW